MNARRREEWTAWIPKDDHDSWSQDVVTPSYASEEALMESLETRASLPGGLKGVRIYCRVVEPNTLIRVIE